MLVEKMDAYSALLKANKVRPSAIMAKTRIPSEPPNRLLPKSFLRRLVNITGPSLMGKVRNLLTSMLYDRYGS